MRIIRRNSVKLFIARVNGINTQTYVILRSDQASSDVLRQKRDQNSVHNVVRLINHFVDLRNKLKDEH